MKLAFTSKNKTNKIIIDQLDKIYEFVSSSDESPFASQSPAEILQEANRLKFQMEQGLIEKDAILSLLAPTGSLQEISIENGWADEFLVLARNIEYHLNILPSS